MFGLEIEVKAYESCLSLRICTVSRAHHGDILKKFMRVTSIIWVLGGNMWMQIRISEAK
jgi:hypothetical protein